MGLGMGPGVYDAAFARLEHLYGVTAGQAITPHLSRLRTAQA